MIKDDLSDITGRKMRKFMKKQVVNLKVMNQNFITNSDTELVSNLINKVANNSNLDMRVSDIILMMSEDMGLSTTPQIHFINGEDALVIEDKDIETILSHPRWFKIMSR